MKSRWAFVAATLTGLTTPASADANLRQELAKPVVATLKSNKEPAELELCVADAVGRSLLPVSFRADVSGTVHMFGFAGLMGSGTVQRVVSLVRTSQGTRVEVRTHSGRPDDALVKVLVGCV